MNLPMDLGSRLSITDIRSLASLAQVDTDVRGALFDAMLSAGPESGLSSMRAAGNAAWALTHLPDPAGPVLEPYRDSLVTLLLSTQDTTLRRLTLNLLVTLEWPKEEVRTDLLDFCLAHLLMPTEPAGIRSLCGKMAWTLCRHYPELLEELRRTLLYIEPETLSPGPRHTRNAVLNSIKKALAILLLLVGLGGVPAAALTDSLRLQPVKVSSLGFGRDSLMCNYDHGFKPIGLIVPGTFVTAATVITAVPSLHQNIDGSIRDWAQSYNPPRVHVDDYVQYVPLGSVFALKAVGLESEHEWRDLFCLTAGSCIVGFAINQSLKHLCAVGRPNNPDERTSFPSGHTTTAFLGAEILRREYGEEYPAVAIAGYTVATGVACMRVWNNRHWFSDILGGAGFSILSVGLTYWLAPYLRF